MKERCIEWPQGAQRETARRFSREPIDQALVDDEAAQMVIIYLYI